MTSNREDQFTTQLQLVTDKRMKRIELDVPVPVSSNFIRQLSNTARIENLHWFDKSNAFFLYAGLNWMESCRLRLILSFSINFVFYRPWFEKREKKSYKKKNISSRVQFKSRLQVVTTKSICDPDVKYCYEKLTLIYLYVVRFWIWILSC